VNSKLVDGTSDSIAAKAVATDTQLSVQVCATEISLLMYQGIYISLQAFPHHISYHISHNSG